MSTRHPFHDTNPKYLDCGTLHDSRTGSYIGEASSRQAAASIKAQRVEGVGHGVIPAPEYTGAKFAVVRPREGTTLADWRLAVALNLKWERSMMREYERQVKQASEVSATGHSEPVDIFTFIGGASAADEAGELEAWTVARSPEDMDAEERAGLTWHPLASQGVKAGDTITLAGNGLRCEVVLQDDVEVEMTADDQVVGLLLWVKQSPLIFNK